MYDLKHSLLINILKSSWSNSCMKAVLQTIFWTCYVSVIRVEVGCGHKSLIYICVSVTSTLGHRRATSNWAVLTSTLDLVHSCLTQRMISASLCEFRLLLLCKWDLHSSGLLCSIDVLLLMDILRQPTSPRTITNYRPALCTTPDEWRSLFNVAVLGHHYNLLGRRNT